MSNGIVQQLSELPVKFLLVFHGECDYAGIFDGFDALLREVREQYTVNEDEHKELLERLENEDSWICDDYGLPWFYTEDTGEIGHMRIYRAA